MNFNRRYNKNHKNNFSSTNNNNKMKNKKILNKKTYRYKQNHNKEIKNNNILDKSEGNYKYNIPGFYYDKNQNRYFSLKNKDMINQLKNKEKKATKIKIIDNKNKRLSHFNIIHFSKFIENKYLKNYSNRAKYLENSNYINIDYEEIRFPNNSYLFYKNKYLLILYCLTDNSTSTSISIYDVINDKFIKKIIIEEAYNNFFILENNLILSLLYLYKSL